MFRGKRSTGEKVFDAFNVLIMLFMIIITLYPIYYVVVCSVSDSMQLIGERGLMLLPKGFSLNAYKAVFSNPSVYTGYRTTLIVVVIGTTINLIMTSIAAFLLTQKQFAIKNFLAFYMIFTMYFSGGMIPSYLLIYKYLGLGDSLWALMLPGAISVYNTIIMKSNFEQIPHSLVESVKLDGGSELTVLLRIILPLSLPIIAVMIMFYGVGHWNSWFNAMLYMRTRSKYPLQLILREILLYSSGAESMSGDFSGGELVAIGESIKYATIMVATLPILCIYPFLQKYFVKGVMVGAVKE